MHVCAHIRNIQANHNINIGKKKDYSSTKDRLQKKKKKRPALKLLMLSSLSEKKKKKTEKPKFNILTV